MWRKIKLRDLQKGRELIVENSEESVGFSMFVGRGSAMEIRMYGTHTVVC